MARLSWVLVFVWIRFVQSSQLSRKESADSLEVQHLHADPKKGGKDAEKKTAAPKKNAKPEDLNKKMPLKAQEQGFTGKKVAHDDGKTATSDWHNEYGNSQSFTQELIRRARERADPKKEAAPAKKDAAPAKKGAKVQDLNKDMPLKAQEQGFAGKKVQHEDGKTGTADWHSEYGDSPSFTQAVHSRGDPKKGDAKPKKEAAAPKKGGKVEDLNKKMPLKAQEQGFGGKKVQHDDGKTATSDWHNEYGNSPAFTQALHVRGDPKKDTAKSKKEAGSSKKDSKAKVENLNKDMPLKAQEQGFTGKKVQHEDGKTGTADWHSEYGPSGTFLHVQASHARGKPEKAATDSKKAVASPNGLQEQGYSGKKVEHVDGETKTADWRNEYGHDIATTQAPKRSGSVRRSNLPVAVLLAIVALGLAQ